MKTISYDEDVILWSKEQAALLRSGRFSQLDIEHLADEIEDVGKSEQRELANRMAVLLAHLLKWQHQPERRSKSWEHTIALRRGSIARRVAKTPGLQATLRDPEWQMDAWSDAAEQAGQETGLDRGRFGAACPWAMERVLAADFWPEDDARAGE